MAAPLVWLRKLNIFVSGKFLVAWLGDLTYDKIDKKNNVLEELVCMCVRGFMELPGKLVATELCNEIAADCSYGEAGGLLCAFTWWLI
jgi:hypothetical protein